MLMCTLLLQQQQFILFYLNSFGFLLLLSLPSLTFPLHANSTFTYITYIFLLAHLLGVLSARCSFSHVCAWMCVFVCVCVLSACNSSATVWKWICTFIVFTISFNFLLLNFGFFCLHSICCKCWVVVVRKILLCLLWNFCGFSSTMLINPSRDFELVWRACFEFSFCFNRRRRGGS